MTWDDLHQERRCKDLQTMAYIDFRNKWKGQGNENNYVEANQLVQQCMPRCFSECISRTLAIFHGNEKDTKMVHQVKEGRQSFSSPPRWQPISANFQRDCGIQHDQVCWYPLFFSRKNWGKRTTN